MRHSSNSRKQASVLPRSLTCILGILALGWGLTARPAVAEDPEAVFIRGDADGDGQIGIADMVMIAQQVAFHLCSAASSDFNDDGKVTVSDALGLMGMLFGDGKSPAEPFPGPGVDPTPGPGEAFPVDPDYGIRASAPRVDGLQVEVDLKYRSATGLQALQLAFSSSADMTPGGGRLRWPFASGSSLNSFQVQPRALSVTLGNTGEQGELLPATSGEWQPLGTLRFTLATPGGDPGIHLEAEIDQGGCDFYSNLYSVVTTGMNSPDPMVDRQPVLEQGPVEGFIRGALGAEGVLAYLWAGGPAPTDCQGKVDLDAADANDNEALTIADYMVLRHAAGGGSIPAPSAVCGRDPSEDRAGFDQLDTPYRVTAVNVISIRNTPTFVTDVHIPLDIDSPADVAGVQLALDYDANVMTPYSDDEGGPFQSVAGRVKYRVVVEEKDGKIIRGILLFTVYAGQDGLVVRKAAAGLFVQLGTLRFHLGDHSVFRPLNWLPEYTDGGIVYRASVVDTAFKDHHPQLVAGEYEFVRGNSNGDSAVDISDAVRTLDYLYTGGKPLSCLDAADVNDDGEIDVSDPIYTISYLFLGGRIIPEPFPQCGLDRSIEEKLDCSLAGEGDACFK